MLHALLNRRRQQLLLLLLLLCELPRVAVEIRPRGVAPRRAVLRRVQLLAARLVRRSWRVCARRCHCFMELWLRMAERIVAPAHRADAILRRIWLVA